MEAVFGVPGVRARLEPMVTWPRRHDVCREARHGIYARTLKIPLNSLSSYVYLGELRSTTKSLSSHKLILDRVM